MGTVVPQPVAVLPAGGGVLKFLGVTHKLTSEQTGGAFYVCEAVFGRESGAPLRTMVSAMPGGLENYFDEVEAALQNGTLANETHIIISTKYGLEWLE